MRKPLTVSAVVFAMVGCLLAVSTDTALAQAFRRPRVQPAPVQPAYPIQPVTPAAPAQPAAPATSEFAGEPGDPARNIGLGGGQQGHIVRGSELIGLQVWDPRNQRLGTINDVVIDYQGGCPSLYFAMSSDVSGLTGYVVVPFDVLRFSVDREHHRNFFVFDTTIDRLRNAPRIDRDNWDRLRDRQFLTRTHDFYQRTERSTARPVSPPERGAGTSHERGRSDTGVDRGIDRDKGTERKSDTGTRNEMERKSDTGTRDELERRTDTGTRNEPGMRDDSGQRRDTGTRGESPRNPQGEAGGAKPRTDTDRGGATPGAPHPGEGGGRSDSGQK